MTKQGYLLTFAYFLLGILLALGFGAYWLLAWLLLCIYFTLTFLSQKTSPSTPINASFLKVTGVALLVIIFIRTFLVDVYQVPSTSMSPTLLPKDKILVNKTAYGFRFPNQLLDIPMINVFHKIITKNNKFVAPPPLPKTNILRAIKTVVPNEVIVFHHPKSRQINVKRCIGVPGDPFEKNSDADFSLLKLIKQEVQEVKKKFIHLPSNQERLEEKKSNLIIPGKSMSITFKAENIHFYQKLISTYEDRKAFVKNNKMNIDGEYVEQYTFMQNYYFVQGDNAENSLDSRHWGLLPQSHLIGKNTGLWLTEKLRFF